MKEIRNELIGIRCSREEKEAIKKAALKDCRTVSQYCLINMLKMAKEADNE